VSVNELKTTTGCGLTHLFDRRTSHQYCILFVAASAYCKCKAARLSVEAGCS